MSLFDEATAFMKDKKTVSDRDENRETLIKKLRAEFENATRIEIERALDKLSERDGVPDDFNILLKKIRVWLED
ncbi:MAG: hypothetical protein IJV07_00955 [Alphaproteobacteria bacterium]|nr:hypothetical protein [Alphaproteobacteria bacterium]